MYPRKRSASTLVFTALILLVSTRIRAADFPRLMIDHKGPVCRVHAMVFAENPTRLYVAGEDKTVEVFFVDGHVNSQPIVTHARTLRWPVSRGSRGRIYSMAMHPTRPLLVVGGNSAVNPEGWLHLLDGGSGTPMGMLPRMPRREAPGQLFNNMHNANVVSAAFSPSGGTLFTSDTYGEIRKWSLSDQTQTSVLRQAFKPDKDSDYTTDRYAVLGFSDSDVINAEPKDWKANSKADRVWNIYSRSSGTQARLLVSQMGKVSSLVASGRLFAAAFATKSGERDEVPNNPSSVVVWSATPSKRIVSAVIPCGDLREPRVIFSESGRLIVAGDLISRTKKKNGLAMVRVYAVSIDTTVTARKVFEYHESSPNLPRDRFIAPDVVASSADGRFLAMYSQPGGLRVYRLGKETIHQECAVVRPRTLSFQSAAFDDEGTFLALGIKKKEHFDPKTAKAVTFFDLSGMRERRGSRARNRKWRLSTVKDDGYEFPAGSNAVVLQDTRTRQRWTLNQRGSGLTCCSIPEVNGDRLVAVATNSSTEIYIHRLLQNGRSQPVRCFRGHINLVKSLTAAPDGLRLVSTSFDHTVRIWNLTGLTESLAADKACVEARLGCRILESGGNGIQVSNINPFGILASHGVQAGTNFTGVLATINRGSSRREVLSDASAILKYLANVVLHDTSLTLFTDQKKQIRFVPSWEAVAVFSQTHNGEWVWTSPRGYSAFSSSRGADLALWQQFMRLAGPMRFSTAHDLAAFEQPKILAELISGELKESVQQVCGQRSGTILKVAFEKQVHVTLRQPSPGKTYGAEERVAIEANVSLPKTLHHKDLVVNAWVNGESCGPSKVAATKGGWRYEWATLPRNAINRVRTVFATRPTAASEIRKATTAAFAANVRRRISIHHLLAIGVKNYQAGSICPPLDYSCDDARAIQRLVNGMSPEFEKGESVVLTDEAAKLTRGDINAAILKLSESIERIGRIRPDVRQQVTVFLCGHGTAWKDSNYYFLPSDVITEDDVATKGVSWGAFEKLAQLPCRKLFIIDTCDAGAVAGEVATNSIKDAAEQIRDEQVVVISGTAREGGSAFQLDQFRHGALTQCLIQGLENGLADGVAESESKDGIITLRELGEYVKVTLPKITKDYVYEEQQATIAPADLLEVQSVPLKRL